MALSSQTGAFDPDALYIALDRRRREQRISASEVLRQAGIRTASSWTRLGRGNEVSLDTFLRLIAWLGTTDISAFTRLPSPPDDAATRSRAAGYLAELRKSIPGPTHG